jgi:hypothetical protein
VRALLAPHNARAAAGTVTVCLHLADPFGPALTALTAVWKPGLMVCPICAGAGALTPANEVEAHTCDLCRRHLPGQVRDVTLRTGMVLVLMGLCRGCRVDFEPPGPALDVSPELAQAMSAELARLTADPGVPGC